MTRASAIEAFLEAHGWSGAARAPLAGDASARRYERLTHGPRRALLMDMPPASGLDPAPYLAVAGWLRRAGFSAPEILAADVAAGLVLVEDLGDALFIGLCAEAPAREAELYAAAVDVLSELQATALPGADRSGWAPPHYDAATLLREARLAVEWYLPAATGAPASADLLAEFEARVAAAVAPLLNVPRRPVLRDYHAENLLWLPDRPGRGRVGLLDFQDMLAGHPAYDVVSLLEDARRDTSPELRAAMIARHLQHSGAEPGAFLAATHVLAAQRNLKILGLFTRLARRDGKPRYLALLPRVWGHLERDLAHDALRDLRRFVARRLPPPEPAVLARLGRAAA